MSSGPNSVDRQLDPRAPAREHFEVVWRTSPGGALKKAGLLAREIFSITLGLHSANEVQPKGIDIRVQRGPLVAEFTYGDDRELARRHTALVENRLSACTVGEFLSFLRETATTLSTRSGRVAHTSTADPGPTPPPDRRGETDRPTVLESTCASVRTRSATPSTP
ncbi:hypothetical protein [Streptomyces sp. NBC_00878]|uniref:hypothetical protein n=1 Tax=Streptomyces sp. NBC_00878 TaxID=2975854 RepID=UPI00225AD205|nr:hypothetical protein [Streptomyces sp. NBC_00878]MCX4904814.1 hypothetical protein [Streptomyces sp. NBC_00878]